MEKSIIHQDIPGKSHHLFGVPGDGVVNVLIVDDDDGIRETMGDILKEMGVNPTLARDGFEAIKIASQSPPDLILMDLRMPGIDGLQTSKKIRTLQPGARIILVTAYATEETYVDARNVGIQEVLYKPLDLGRLMEIINKNTPYKRD